MQTLKANRSLHLGIFLASAFVGYSGPASAQSDIQETVQVTTGLERPKSISLTEITILREQVFERMDRNGDGVLSDRDHPTHSTGIQFGNALENLQSRFDENGDHEISKMEMMDAPSAAFSFGDTIGDDFLSEPERGATRLPHDRQ